MANKHKMVVGLVVLYAAAGCSGTNVDKQAGHPTPTQSPPSVPRASSAPVTAPVTAAGPSLPPGCAHNEGTSVTCEFIAAVQTRDYRRLNRPERKVAAAVRDLPQGSWRSLGCQLEGDVTVVCRVQFDTSAALPGDSVSRTATFHLQPVNGRYEGERLTSTDGQEIRHEIVSYDGLGGYTGDGG